MLLSLFLKKEDFKQVKHFVLFKNNTSGTSVLNPKLITIGELSDDTITLQVPRNSCVKGHNVTLFIFKAPLSMSLKRRIKKGIYKDAVELLGKVTKQWDDSYGMYINIEFTQFDESEWKKIVKSYADAQNAINDIV